MFSLQEITVRLFLGFIILGLSKIGLSQSIEDRHCNLHRMESSQQFEQWLASKRPEISTRNNEILKIPVVIHVVHAGEPVGVGSNLSDEQIHSQVRVLNEDFRRQTGTRGYNDHPDGEDAMIEFVLAKSDPEGKATDGITRTDFNSVESPAFGGSMIALGAYYNIWDPGSYLNIWTFPGFQDTGLGEARFPISDLPGLEGQDEFTIPGVDSLHGIPVSEIDGIAVNSVHFGESNINSVYNLGRTGTHEVGHFLGLFHLWGDEGFEGSCDIDDYCEDTPLVERRTSGCPTNKMACDGSPAMIRNYMDYSDDACMNLFTRDQVQRMRIVLKNSPRRKSLLISKGLLPPDNVVNTDDGFPIEFKVYPNPFSKRITIEPGTEWKSKQGIITITDVHGRIIHQESYVSAMEQMVVELSETHHGVLILHIQFGQFSGSQKIIQI